MKDFPGGMLENVRRERPLVHCITNYVTVTDCANILLATGAAPIMADAMEEVAEFAQKANALYLNIGTLNEDKVAVMRRALQPGLSTVLDPVGAGATQYRTQTALSLLSTGRITLLRGNISEIRALAGCTGSTRGTDAAKEDVISEETAENVAAFATELSARLGCLIGISGPIDIVADGKRVALIRNGHPIMPTVTGTGCMLSAVCAAFLGVPSDDPFESVAAAFCAVGLCGELAFSRLSPAEGPLAWRTRFNDALSQLTGATLRAGAKVEIT